MNLCDDVQMLIFSFLDIKTLYKRKESYCKKFNKIINHWCNYNRDKVSLHDSSHHGYLEVLQYLLTKKINIEAKDNKGKTSLILASYNGHDKCVEILLKYNANI